MNPATINQSSRMITDAIYAQEHFDNQDQQEREAIDMDDFHRQTYEKQLEANFERRKALELQALKAEEEETKRALEAQKRQKEEKALEEKYHWDLVKNHWYWGDYQKTIPYGHVDNYLDSMKPENHHKVELSNDYKQITSHKFVKPVGETTNQTFTYRAPFREYSYDYGKDKLLPNDSRYVTENNILNLDPKCLKSNDQEGAFDQKYKEKIEDKESKEQNLKEGFENQLDPKLMQIYSKTLSPQEDPQVQEENKSFFTYAHCLILIIIFFFLFRNSS